MVYVGGPSRGCDTCRARKVKCSEETPHCLRCKQGGFLCLGYKQRPRAALKDKSYKVQTQIARKSKVKLSPLTEEVPYNIRHVESPTFPWESTASSYFIDQFVVTPYGDQRIGWFEFIPDLLPQAEPGSALDSAFQAIANLSLANRFEQNDLKLEALRLNGKALHAVNEAIQSPVTATDDATFATILILCLFGHINGDLRLQIGAHAAGIYGLLALRSQVGTRSKHAESLTRHFFSVMHLENNETYLSTPPPPDEGQSTQMATVTGSDLFSRLDKLWPRSATLLLHIKDCLTTDLAQQNPDSISAFMEKAQNLDQQVESATYGLDSVWSYGTVNARDMDQRSKWITSSNKALTYHDAWIMSLWNAYRVTRISLHTVLMGCYEALRSAEDQGLVFCNQSLDELRMKSTAVIDDMNEEICASVPWTFGHVEHGNKETTADLPKASRASLSIVGLKTVVNGHFTRQYHATQAKAALREIADRFGIMGALI